MPHHGQIPVVLALLGVLVVGRGGAYADGCDVAAVERANAEQLIGILDELANTTYFRMMEINMEGKCKFWGDQPEKKCNKTLPPVDGDSEDVQGGGGGLPKKKKACDLNLGGNKVKAPAVSKPPSGMLGGFQPPSASAKSVTPEERNVINTQRVREDATLDDYWVDLCRTIPTNTSDYINLQLNPERWTGYNGSRVWEALYVENLFRSSLQDMSFSERVLYRMLSGMHASINIHISETYYPPSKLRPNWEPNLDKFARNFGDSPERLKNLHFAYVVLLRALERATPFLYNFPFAAGEDVEEDKYTMRLVQRLLDSHVLKSASGVFGAFDEQRMFASPKSSAPSSSVAREDKVVELKTKFKGVFQNVSAVLDCVSCQKCRLHGKIQLLGMGTALKMLLLPEALIASSVTRAELVALFNTLHKFGKAIRAVPLLIAQYLAKRTSAAAAPPTAAAAERPHQPAGGSADAGRGVDVAWGAVDAGVAAIAAAAAKGVVDRRGEETMLDALLGREDDVLLLAKHYALARPERFIEHVRRAVANPSRVPTRSSAGAWSGSGAAVVGEGVPLVGGGVDAVVIGGGLAGLSAALTILDAGGRVVVLEKMGHLGGNSAWASSGVNAVDVNDTKTQDTVDIFTADVVKAAGRGDNPLIRVLTEGSVDALAWLRSRLAENLNLDLVGQMGGHSKARTHRPSSGLAGSAMIFAIQKQLEKYMLPHASGSAAPLELMKWTRATKLIREGDAVVGVEYAVVTAKDQNTPVRTGVVRAAHVLVATGGYASDYTQDSLLSKHRPDLLTYATTNNKGTTGDGHKLALAIGAKAVDLDDVQVHPTGFHNPADPSNKVKTLAAEITRGEGAILLHRGARRFVNELGGRDHVTGRMLDVAKDSPPVWEADGSDGKLLFALVMNSKGAAKTAKHIDLYTKKKLLTKFDALKDLAAWSYWNASVSEASLRSKCKLQ